MQGKPRRLDPLMLDTLRYHAGRIVLGTPDFRLLFVEGVPRGNREAANTLARQIDDQLDATFGADDIRVVTANGPSARRTAEAISERLGLESAPELYTDLRHRHNGEQPAEATGRCVERIAGLWNPRETAKRRQVLIVVFGYDQSPVRELSESHMMEVLYHTHPTERPEAPYVAQRQQVIELKWFETWHGYGWELPSSLPAEQPQPERLRA